MSEYLAWRCTYQSGEAAAQAAWHALQQANQQTPSPHVVRAITVAYEQGFGKGQAAFRTKKEVSNPYDKEMGCAQAWGIGYDEGKKFAERTQSSQPKFDGIVPEQEALAAAFSIEVRDAQGACPVRILEMAERLYRAEMGE